jgi:phosphatidylglycerol:prolipoprotein diacylglycerol transferase
VYPVIWDFGTISLFGLEFHPIIHSFGAMMALGFFVATYVSSKEYERRGGDSDEMWNLLLYVFIGGLVGSKILSLGNDIPAFFANPIEQVTAGSGFVWYGGLLGGVGTAWVLHKRYDVTFPTLLECTALGLPIGQAIGRIGCHVAGDGDWGIVTDLPWGVAYTQAIIGWNYPSGVTVHPTPLYEFTAYMGLFLFLYARRKRDLPPPTMFATYLVGASLARFAVEFIRLNPKVALGLTQAQLIALVLISLGVVLLMRTRGRSIEPESVR